MRVLFTSLRNTSHFLPLVPFLDACRARGHEVGVAAPPDLAERATKAGAVFFPFGHPGDDGLRPLWTRMRALPEEARNDMVIREIFAGACAGAALPALLETVTEWRPSILVRESQEYAAVVAAAKAGLPHVRVSIMARAVEARLFALAAEALDAHRGSVGLRADPSGDALRGEPALTLFPPTLDGAEGPSRRFRALRKEASPLPESWGSPRDPFVYVTFGTVAGGMEPLRAAYRAALEAVAELPIRVLLTIGAELPLDALGEVPRNVRVERFVPQDDVLPHAAAVVCHGGAGTTLGALAAGVPLVVAPLFADQPYNAERVAAVGAGLALPLNGASAGELRGALSRVLREPAFRDAARRLAREIAALPPVSEAGEELERLAK
jgi:UDP:flavonoid glycosyltransferase YjiC (YdhE family)